MICFGGMHGNEQAGVRALEQVFKMLEAEPITNPSFQFKGRLLGLHGNLRALRYGLRFHAKDLNRHWEQAHIDLIMGADADSLDEEDHELREILHTIHQEIEDYQPDRMVVLDLHTTSAFGGIFAIVNEDPESLKIARELHAPVVKGMMKGLKGTTLHYFTDENFGVQTVAVSFEAGQHDEPLSVDRSVACIINCLRTLGCVRPSDVENRHDQLLIDFSKDLPKVTELIGAYRIKDQSSFQLLPGLENFQRVSKGELLGYEMGAPILATEDCLLLMPRYQSQGTDGFFMIRAVE